MSIVYRYTLVLIACIAILIGIQIPNYINQYEQRLDAHFLEVKNNLSGFQEIADRYYGGSIELLIKKHEASEDITFREEAEPIRNMYERYLRFKDEKLALETGLAGKIIHLIISGDRELMDETYENYTFTVPLTREAVIVGFISAGFFLVIFELLRALFLKLFKRRNKVQRKSTIYHRIR